MKVPDMSGIPLNTLIHQKNQCVYKNVSNMTVKRKRKLFSILRKKRLVDNNKMNYVFPTCNGITIGEFCTAHVLQGDVNRRKRSSTSIID
jgi:hypothetical protein